MSKYAILGYIATRKSVTLMFWWCLDIHVIKSYIMGWRECCTTSFCNCCFFCLFQCFAEKEYQTESKQNETFGRVIFGMEAIQETWSRHRGSFEVATRIRGAPYPLGMPPFLEPSLAWTPSLPDHILSKNHAPEGFIPFGLRLIFLFFEILKQAIKQQYGPDLWLIG